MNERRICSRFYCDRQRERVCCTSCKDGPTCFKRCLNSPERCGLEEKEDSDVNKNRKRIY